MTSNASTKRIARTWPVLLLLLPAFVAIWGGWVGLGEKTGFGIVNLLPGMGGKDGYGWAIINTAITLPIGLETYAGYALHVFLAAWSLPGHRALKHFSGWSALAALLLGGGGQVAYHVMEAEGIERAPIWVTSIVGSLPVVVLGMGSVLAALVRQAEAGHGDTGPKRSLAERVAAARSSLDSTLAAATASVPKVDPIGAVPAPVLSTKDLGPERPPVEVPQVPDPEETPAPKVPNQRTPRRTEWDVAKAVQMILDGEKDPAVADAVGIGVKMIQRTRRAVQAIRQDPHVTIPQTWKVPAPVIQIIRTEVPR